MSKPLTRAPVAVQVAVGGMPVPIGNFVGLQIGTMNELPELLAIAVDELGTELDRRLPGRRALRVQAAADALACLDDGDARARLAQAPRRGQTCKASAYNQHVQLSFIDARATSFSGGYFPEGQ